jgi:hypothetical protein
VWSAPKPGHRVVGEAFQLRSQEPKLSASDQPLDRNSEQAIVEESQLALASIATAGPFSQAGLHILDVGRASFAREKPVDGGQKLHSKGGLETVDPLAHILERGQILRRFGSKVGLDLRSFPVDECDHVRSDRVGDTNLRAEITPVEAVEQMFEAKLDGNASLNISAIPFPITPTVLTVFTTASVPDSSRFPLVNRIIGRTTPAAARP